MRRGRGRRRGLALSADINVTSLVDVAFTLLVIFIITAPIMQGGIEIAVPQADAAPLDASDDPVIVSVTRAGTVFVDETEVEREAGDLERTLERLVEASGGSRTIFVKADSLAEYRWVLDVIGRVNAVEGTSMGLISNPRPRRP